MYITTPIGPKSVSSLSYQILFTKSSLDVVRSIIEPSIYCAVIDANYSLSPGFIHSQLAVFANRLLWTNLTISRNINNVGLSHCGWVFIVQRTYVVWGGRCNCRFLYYNGHICSRKPRNKVRAPREKNPSHHGVRWVHWGVRRRFMVVTTIVPLHTIATAVAMVIVFKWGSCESANKKGG